jgi:hypothetical protein
VVRGRRTSDEEAFGIKSQANFAFFTIRWNYKIAKMLKIHTLWKIYFELWAGWIKKLRPSRGGVDFNPSAVLRSTAIPKRETVIDFEGRCINMREWMIM